MPGKAITTLPASSESINHHRVGTTPTQGTMGGSTGVTNHGTVMSTGTQLDGEAHNPQVVVGPGRKSSRGIRVWLFG